MPTIFRKSLPQRSDAAAAIPGLWPSIVVFACGAILAAGALALMVAGIALAFCWVISFFPRRDKRLCSPAQV